MREGVLASGVVAGGVVVGEDMMFDEGRNEGGNGYLWNFEFGLEWTKVGDERKKVKREEKRER